MNPPTVVELDAQKRVRRGLGLGAGALVLGLAAAVALTFLVGLSSGPSTIPRITFENPTPYALDIEVRAGDTRGWTSAGSVRQESTAEVHEVIDQGDVWLFRFDSQGASGGEVHLTRAELEASDWTVTIPAEVGTRLADAGAPPTP
ncbi:MAG TPA: hypothetical protein VJ653_01355 [Acidimicrobiales bacterium]|nr:hypothetical protein [Acidimicrobiales bacterium]